MRFIKLKEVMKITGLGRSSIYKFMADATFPQTISLGERAVAWEESEVEEWQQAKIESRSEIVSYVEKSQSTKAITEDDVINFIKNKFTQLSLNDAITWIMKIVK